jgi:hypothetical protein
MRSPRRANRAVPGRDIASRTRCREETSHVLQHFDHLIGGYACAVGRMIISFTSTFLGPGRGVLPERVHPHIDYVESEEFFIDPETKGHERGLLGAGLSLLKPVDLAGFREQVQRFAP